MTGSTSPDLRAGVRLAGYGSLAFWTARLSLRAWPAFVANILSAVIQLLVAYFLWRTYFTTNTVAGPYDQSEIRLFLLVALMFGAILTGYDEWRNALRVLNGDVAVDLVRPLRYGRARLAELTGSGLVELAVMVVAGAGIALLLGGVHRPVPAVLPAALLSAVLGVVVKAQIVCCTVLLCFGRDSYLGLHWTRMGLVTLFAGTFVPIDLYPAWLRDTALVLPFQAIIYAPFRVLTASGWDAQVAGALLRQAGSVLVMGVLMEILNRRAMRQVEAVG
jgi:ABC-2 type transport system permease protein